MTIEEKRKLKDGTPRPPPEWFKKALGDARCADKLGITMEELEKVKERKPWSLKEWRLALKVNCRILMIMGDGYRALRAKVKVHQKSAVAKPLLRLNPRLLK